MKSDILNQIPSCEWHGFENPRGNRRGFLKRPNNLVFYHQEGFRQLKNLVLGRFLKVTGRPTSLLSSLLIVFSNSICRLPMKRKEAIFIWNNYFSHHKHSDEFFCWSVISIQAKTVFCLYCKINFWTIGGFDFGR